MVRHKRHFKDSRRARALRDRAALVPAVEGQGALPPLEKLCRQGGNVFAELGFPHPEQELFKGLLTLEICRIIKDRNLTQVQAGEILGIGQQRVSKLLNHHLSAYSSERLVGYLLALGRDVVLNIRPTEEGKGTISVASNSVPQDIEDDKIGSRLRDLSQKGMEFFSGLGFRQPAPEALKVLLSGGVSKAVDEHVAADVDVGKRLRISRQTVLKLQKREFSSFSLGELIEYLVILGHDVTIHLSPSRQPGGIVSVNYPSKLVPSLFPTLFMPILQGNSADEE